MRQIERCLAGDSNNGVLPVWANLIVWKRILRGFAEVRGESFEWPIPHVLGPVSGG